MVACPVVPRIVVGIDGSVAGDEPLRCAVRLAASGGAKLDVALAWTPRDGRTRDDAERDLHDAVRRVVPAGLAPSVLHVRPWLLGGSPGTALVAAARGADLLVIGGGRAGAVSRYCLSHAGCPVVVVPRRAAGPESTGAGRDISASEPAWAAVPSPPGGGAWRGDGTMAQAPDGLDVIPYQECLELLDTEEVGRLCVVLDGRPEVFPVNYVLAGDRILFRTDVGTKLSGATHGPVAFEVDRLDRATRSGWSVVVHGRAAVHTVFDSHAEQRAARLWLHTERPHLVLVTPDPVGGISGRRIAGARRPA